MVAVAPPGCAGRGAGPSDVGGPENTTNVPSYFSYQNFFPKSQVGYGAAIATVLTVIVVVVALAFIRAQAASERKEGV